MSYRKGYFRALLDVLNFLEYLQESIFIKSHAERWKVAIAVIREVLVSGKLERLYCSHCRKPIKNNKNFRFCPRCGKAIDWGCEE